MFSLVTGAHVSKTFDGVELFEDCKVCGIEFSYLYLGIGRRRKFCSAECKKKGLASWQRSRRECLSEILHILQCRLCGEHFSAKCIGTRFCKKCHPVVALAKGSTNREAICKGCGTKFKYIARKKAVWCSKNCFNKHYISKHAQEKPCKHCGKFFKSKWEKKSRAHVFCSKTCAQTYNHLVAGHVLGGKSKEYRHVECGVCGHSFIQKRGGASKYCGKECAAIALLVKKKDYNKMKARKSIEDQAKRWCRHCAKVGLPAYRYIFCSNVCAAKFRRKMSRARLDRSVVIEKMRKAMPIMRTVPASRLSKQFTDVLRLKYLINRQLSLRSNVC